MSVRFILGRSGSGKTEKCLNEIREKLFKNPNGSPIIYLVPEQMTFQSEYKLINTPNLGGLIRTQVFSFTRLAWRILQETGGITRYHLNNVGVYMILRKIIEQRKEDFKVFRRASDQSGFVTQIEEMITEFKRYCVDADQLKERYHDLRDETTYKVKANQEVLANKMHDFQIIYEEFEKHLLNRYVDSEDYLRLLSEKIARSSSLENTEIYVDGFHSFTPQELLVLGELMKNCKRVNISLTLDRPYDEFDVIDLDLFHMTAKTYKGLRQLALENEVEIEDYQNLDKKFPRFQTSSSLAHLEEFYEVRPSVPYYEESDLQINAAVNRRAEVETLANEMIKLIRNDGYRWRDFAILVRNSNDYHDLIDTIFSDYEIPVFIDQKRSMLNHPLLELIRSSMDVLKGNWRYDAVFRCVKTDLLRPIDKDKYSLREDLDQLENYVLAYGIQGHRWKAKDRWSYRMYRSIEDQDIGKTDEEKEFEDKINDLRYMITDPLIQLEKGLKKAKTGRELCEALYMYLEALQIPKKIESLRNEAESLGNLSAAREHDQVWNSIIDWLDQMVEVIGEEELNIDMFYSLMETGLESMKFALVPPAMDQVLVASIDRSRLSDIKCTFILGVNDGVLPAKPKEDGVISDEERELLITTGMDLAASSKQQLLDENFLIYLALSSPSERLWISYPLSDEEGKALVPSVLINRMKELFPNVKERLLLNEPNEETIDYQMNYISKPRKALSYLAVQLQNWKRGYPVDSLWWDVYNWFAEKEEWKLQGQRILSSLYYRNEPSRLSSETSTQLYGKDIQVSVSRMEKFQSCAFSQFVSHGLKLKEREVHKLEAPDIGELFHSALKVISDRLRENKREWSDLTKQECEKLSFDVVEYLAPKIQREILFSSNRYHYIKRKLSQVITRASFVLSEHAKASQFVPIGLELDFGKGKPLPPMKFTLSNGVNIEVAGRIDRIDKANRENSILLRIIDYKSSEKSLNLSEVYYGLAMQMLTYLDVVITHAEEWLGAKASPAGVLYFHVHNPMLNKNSLLKEEDIEKELFKKFKMKGLLVADEDTVRLMDQTLDTGYSDILPVNITKNGAFHKKHASVASNQDFDYLRKFVRQKIETIGSGITSGQIDLNPYKLSDHTPCRFCSYKAVCQFDQTLEENDFRSLKSEEPEVMLEKIRKEVGEGGN